MTGSPHKEFQTQTNTEGKPREDTQRTQPTIIQPERCQDEIKPANALLWHFQAPEL